MIGKLPTSDKQESRAAPSADHVRAYLEELLKDGRLKTSQQRTEFLRYIVEQTLDGRADHLKGFNIAVAVYGRDETFDPQTDPVIRLEARRLRRDLDSHYAGSGDADPIRITIPKGAYVPQFKWRENGPPNTRANPPGVTTTARASLSTRRLPVLVMTLVLAATLLGLAWKLFAPGNEPGRIVEPRVLVTPFQFSGKGELPADLAAGLTLDLVDDLVRFSGFSVYAIDDDPAALRRDNLKIPVGEGSPAFVVSGHLIVEQDQLLVWARLTDFDSDEILWSDHWERKLETPAILEIHRNLADIIATEIGEPFGIIVNYAHEEVANPEVENLPSYVCVQRAFAFRRNFEAEQFGPVLNCLERAVREDPRYSDAWAMLGWSYLDAGRFNFLEIDDLDRQYERALEAANKALILDPLNTTALKALSSINHYMGYYEESRQLVRRALEINPNDPDALAQYGWRLVVRGQSDEGVAALNEAIERSVNPPGWYFCLLAVDDYLKGDFESMLAASRKAITGGCALSPAVFAIANARLGRRRDTERAFDMLAEYEFIARDPAAFLRRHGFTDEINQKLVDGLIEAEAFLATGE